MDIKLLMLFALGAVSAASKSHWKLTSQDNKIYSGDVKFQMNLSQSWECAKACNKYGVFCLAFGFVPSTGICYGYGETTEPEYITGAQLWSRMCLLPGYHMEPTLEKCIKFYTKKVKWFQASRACRAKGASLLRLDKQESVLGWRHYGNRHSYWIGGKGWNWQNGVEVKASQWRRGFPNRHTCINIIRSTEGLTTYNCHRKLPYICQE